MLAAREKTGSLGGRTGKWAFGIPGERKAGGSSIPPQTAFVKKACRAERKRESMKRSFSFSMTMGPKLCKGLF
jgi:hypothetical protein